MADETKRKQTQALTDDSLAYEQAQEAAVQVDDPLAAIKALRLGQLAVCRLKSEEEMQAMRDALDGNATNSSELDG